MGKRVSTRLFTSLARARPAGARRPPGTREPVIAERLPGPLPTLDKQPALEVCLTLRGRYAAPRRRCWSGGTTFYDRRAAVRGWVHTYKRSPTRTGIGGTRPSAVRPTSPAVQLAPGDEAVEDVAQQGQQLGP
jgi:hypothetical protein